MTEIEDMAITLTEASEDRSNFFADPGWRCLQDCRVHISLQRNLVTDTRSGYADINGPIQPYRIAAAASDAFEPHATIFGEQYARHLATVFFLD